MVELDERQQEMAEAVAVLKGRKPPVVNKTLATMISREYCQAVSPVAGKTLEQHLAFLRKFGKRHLSEAKMLPESTDPEEQLKKSTKIAWATSILDVRSEIVRAHTDLAGQPVDLLNWVRAAKQAYPW